MCNLTTRTNKRIAYKVVAVKNNKFYSTFTGQKLVIGAVPKAPRGICNSLSGNWNLDLFNTPLKKCSFYKKDFNGFSSGFINKKDVTQLRHKILSHLLAPEYSIVIVKITFSNIVYNGTYDILLQDYPIIAGNTIKSMKITKL